MTLLLDTSAAVALVLGDHEHHDGIVEATGDAELGLSGHAAYETYSVLTRLPAPNRRSARVVLEILQTNFPQTVFLSSSGQAQLHRDLATLGLSGGSVYDALVAAAAVEAGMPLLTRDRRAVDVYRSLGVDVRFDS